MKLEYINHKDEKLDLSGEYIAVPDSIFNWEWTPAGELVIDGLMRDIYETELPILIQSHNRNDLSKKLNKLHDITYLDLSESTQGRLKLDTGDYLPCVFIAGEFSDWEDDLREVIKTVKVYTDSPAWQRAFKYHFSPTVEEVGTSAGGYDYPYDYPYDYGLKVNSMMLQNDAVGGSDFELIIFGPVINPRISIGKNRIGIGDPQNQIELLSSGYLIMDSRDSTIYQINANGERTNRYNWRVKSFENFAKMPYGRSVIQSNCYFDLTVFQERNEPHWNL